jgi:hypothetical protein
MIIVIELILLFYSVKRNEDLSILKPDSLLTLPEAEAEAFMNDLSLAEQASAVLMTPWERRQEIILLSQDSRTLVQGLPVQERRWHPGYIG